MGQTNQEPLVSFEQAKGLKSIGFNWPTSDHFFDGGPNASTTLNYNGGNDRCFSRPTISQALRWFRVEKGIVSWISILEILGSEKVKYTCFFQKITGKWQSSIKTDFLMEEFYDYDLAAYALLDKLIELTAPPSVTGDEHGPI